MIYTLFKSKILWVIWLVLSLVGAIIGYVLSRQQKERINNSELVQIQHFYKPEREHIMGIEDTLLKNEYIEFIHDTIYPKNIHFEFATMMTDKEIYAMQYNSDSSLTLVCRINDEPTGLYRRYTELWIWSEHVIRNNNITQ